MFVCAALLGLRAGEILGLRVEDVDLQKQTLNVKQSAWRGKLQTTKNEASENTLPIPVVLAGFFREYLNTWKLNPLRLLFCNRRARAYTSQKVVEYHLWPLLDALKITRAGFHAFRHAHTTLLLEGGASPKMAQRQLRHSDARATLGIYAHLVEGTHRDAVEKLASFLVPNGPNGEDVSLRYSRLATWGVGFDSHRPLQKSAKSTLIRLPLLTGPSLNLCLKSRVCAHFAPNWYGRYWCLPRLPNSTPFEVQLRYANHEIHSGRGVGLDEPADSHSAQTH
jgi:Phage integrase family